MNCTEFERRLQAAVESREPLPPEAAAEWAAHCPACLRAWEDHELLERAVRQWSPRVPRVELADAVLARRAFDEPAGRIASVAPAPDRSERATPAPRPFRRSFAMSAATAAALLVCLALFLFRPATPVDGPDPHGTEPIAVLAPRDSAPDPAVRAEWMSLLRDAGSAYLVLARDATDDAVAVVDLLVPSRRPSDGDTPPLSAGRPAWVDGVGEELAPIGQDVGRAVEFLFDTVSFDVPETI